jgi:hypothetical protein
MAGNLKILGLAVVAVFSLSAVVASTAWAQQGKITSDGPVTLDLTETGANSWTTFGLKGECPGTFTGHEYNVTPHKSIAAGATKITITAFYSIGKCVVFHSGGEQSVTVTMNGCDYVLNLGSTVEADRYALTTDIMCPPGKAIEMHNWFPAVFGKCTLTIKSQTGIGGATVAANTGSNDLSITGTFKEILLERHGSGFGCSSETSTGGTRHVNLTIQGTDGFKNVRPIGISD